MGMFCYKNTVLLSQGLHKSFAIVTNGVTPLFKQGEQNDLNNCHRISAISVVAKVLERIAYDQLYTYLADNDLYHNNNGNNNNTNNNNNNNNNKVAFIVYLEGGL